ncbi:hypothetical protein [uncultured Mediterranean phage uvDeep-CGR2-AD10-C281]|jgi:hypothetical protein|nr:hypothetical protein [uncultured Mediterranean phage uvDeep-CGR2-AD10-C281]
MSFLGGGSGGGGGQTQVVNRDPWSPAQPALQQIISEAGKVYGGGVGQYVAPTTQTLTGLSQQEADAAAARSQLQSTLAGGYVNPYLNPLIQQAAGDVYTNVASQFSGAGRTPGSPVSQQQVATQTALAALPYAFQNVNTERARQLQVAQQAPTLLQTGQGLEALTRQAQMAPFQNLQAYGSLISPIASGFPSQQQQVNYQTNPLTTGMGGAMLGYGLGGGTGALLGGVGGLLGGLLL